MSRGLEYEFQSFAEYHNIGILVWSPLAGGFLSGKYSRVNPAPAGTRFAEAGNFVPFDKEMGYRVVETLKEGPLEASCWFLHREGYVPYGVTTAKRFSIWPPLVN